MDWFLFWQIFTLFTCIIGSICGIISLYVCINVLVEQRAARLSTHTLQYVPAELPEQVEKKTDDFNRSNLLEEDELHDRF